MVDLLIKLKQMFSFIAVLISPGVCSYVTNLRIFFQEVGQVQEDSLEADFTEFLKKMKERNPEVLIALAVTKNTEILNACGNLWRQYTDVF